MAANCLIYRRCRANAINKPLYREDSFVSMSIVFPVVRIRIRLERKKNTRHSHFPCITHSLDSYCFFDLYNIEHRLLFVSFRALVFPPPEPSFTLSLTILRHSNAAPPHPILPQKRRGEESEIGEANDRFLQIFYPWKCIKVLVYLYIPPMYILYIFTLHGRSICTKTVIREEDSLNIKRIFAAINRRVVTIGEGRGIGKGGNITTRSLLFLIVGRWSANKSSSLPFPPFSSPLLRHDWYFESTGKLLLSERHRLA